MRLCVAGQRVPTCSLAYGAHHLLLGLALETAQGSYDAAVNLPDGESDPNSVFIWA